MPIVLEPITDLELAEAIAELQARILSGVESTTTDGVTIKYGPISEARAELRRLMAIYRRRAGCTKRSSIFRPMYGSG